MKTPGCDSLAHFKFLTSFAKLKESPGSLDYREKCVNNKIKKKESVENLVSVVVLYICYMYK